MLISTITKMLRRRLSPISLTSVAMSADAVDVLRRILTAGERRFADVKTVTNNAKNAGGIC
jgi:hypothetical protein